LTTLVSHVFQLNNNTGRKHSEDDAQCSITSSAKFNLSVQGA